MGPKLHVNSSKDNQAIWCFHSRLRNKTPPARQQALKGILRTGCLRHGRFTRADPSRQSDHPHFGRPTTTSKMSHLLAIQLAPKLE
jgi:hypothetical protein